MTGAGSAPLKAQALSCPNCGAPIELRGFANTLTAVCGNCATVLDTSTPALQILHQFDQRQIRKPAIPLGSRGKFGNVLYEVIGFQVRGIEDGETVWEWAEYVLFNPYRGFLYLTEYHGHWNLVRPVHALPALRQAGTRPAATWRGLNFRHFQHAGANTIFVLGEFPWRVQVDETVGVDDFTSPPYVLSAERTGNETTWSEGEYLEGRQVWRALGLKGSPPPVSGVYINQPSPAKSSGGVMKLCGLLEFSVLVLLLFFLTFDRRETVLQEEHYFTPSPNSEASFVTPVFELKGHPSSVVVQTQTDLENNWVYFNYALINNDDGHAYDFGREVSFYEGADSDGTWREGSRNDRVRIPAVPPGHYYLRVEPESDPKTPRRVEYTIVVGRDVPDYTYYVIAALLIPLPAIFIVWRRYKFEYQRWQESDYATNWSKSES